jgi:hypothetical protein
VVRQVCCERPLSRPVRSQTEVVLEFGGEPAGDVSLGGFGVELTHQWADQTVVLVGGFGYVSHTDGIPAQQQLAQLPLRVAIVLLVSRISRIGSTHDPSIHSPRPASSLFLTPDPYFLEQQPEKFFQAPRGLQLYTYVLNNPLNMVDLSFPPDRGGLLYAARLAAVVS